MSSEAEHAKIRKYCGKAWGNVQIGGCLAESLERLRSDLEKEVRRKLFEIDEVERKRPEIGVLSGKEAAERWRASFKAEQAGWQTYERHRCNDVGDFEFYGGSGAGNAQMDCSIILVLRRMIELREPPS